MSDSTDRDDSQGQPELENIAIELKRAREAKSLSLADLHRITGMSRNTLHQYETSARRPGAKELRRLCEVLEVSPNRLLFGSEEPFGNSTGVLTSVLKLSNTDPKRAVVASVFILPVVAAAMKSIGLETLEAIATIADEAIRIRDPEGYAHLADLVEVLVSVDADAISELPEEERQKAVESLVEAQRQAREQRQQIG